jgi:hypothetical protein
VTGQVASPLLARECRLFTRYLVDGAADAALVGKYAAAHGVRPELSPGSRFERIDLGLARQGVWPARMADAHARIFAPRTALRRKLILLLAILETTPPHARRIDDPGGVPPALVPLRLVGHGLLAMAVLAVGSIILLPAQLACRLAGGGR